MKNIKKIIATAMISVFAVTAVGCNMIKKTPEAIKKTVVAKVGDEKITQGDLDKELEPVISQLKQQFGENYTSNEQAMQQLNDYKKQTVEGMVQAKVFAKKGNYNKEEIEKEVDKNLAEIKEQLKDKYEEALNKEKLTEDVLKEKIRLRTISQKVYEDILKDVSVSDEDVKKNYDENKDVKYINKPGADMYHILLKDEEAAKKAKARLDKGEDFKKVSDEVSEDPGAKAQGGSLGFVEYDTQTFDKDFLAGAKALKEGEISAPVKTQFGYHIIMVKNVKTTGSVKPFEEVKDSIKADLENRARQDKFNTTYEQWKKDLNVEIIEKNITAK